VKQKKTRTAYPHRPFFESQFPDVGGEGLDLKENPVKRKIKEGNLVLGSYCNPQRTYLIELMAEAGYDFVVLDTEHGPFFGVEHCIEGVRTAHASNITPFIRVSHNNPVLIEKALETGACGVWVPHVESREECQQAVEAARFPPKGNRRGVGVAPKDWEYANEQTLVAVLPLETKRAIQNIEDTLSVQGIDLVSLSTGDITVALGYPGQPMHPEVVKVRDRVLDLCKNRGLVAYAVGSTELLQYYYRRGVRVFMSETNLRRAFQDHVKELRRILS